MSTLCLHKVTRATRHWWLLPLSGFILIGLGIWIFTEPLTAYLSICIIYSVGLVATGLFELLFVMLTKRASGIAGWALLSSFIDLFTGTYLLCYPLISLVLLPVILGLWLMLRGVLAIASAWEMRKRSNGGRMWLLLSGFLILVVSGMVLTNLIWRTAYIILFTGIGFISAGMFRTYLGFRMRSLNTHDQRKG